MARTHKYRAVRTVVDGRTFASKREARRYGELRLMERAGNIGQLELQPVYVLHAPGGQVIGKYVADFRYVDAGGDETVEDAKGVRTPLYRWKKKHAEAEYGITIFEV